MTTRGLALTWAREGRDSACGAGGLGLALLARGIGPRRRCIASADGLPNDQCPPSRSLPRCSLRAKGRPRRPAGSGPQHKRRGLWPCSEGRVSCRTGTKTFVPLRNEEARGRAGAKRLVAVPERRGSCPCVSPSRPHVADSDPLVRCRGLDRCRLKRAVAAVARHPVVEWSRPTWARC
jgi:hypothetical protein